MDIQNAAFMIPRAMTTIVQEGIEPLLVAEKLLQKIQYKPGMTTVFPAIESLRADEAADGTDLPIYNINIGGAQSFAVTVKRHGLRQGNRPLPPMRSMLEVPLNLQPHRRERLARAKRNPGREDEQGDWQHILGLVVLPGNKALARPREAGRHR